MHRFNDEDVEASAFCGMLDQPMFLNEVSSCVFFLLPLLAMLFMYIMMGCTLSRQSRHLPTLSSRKSILKMLSKTNHIFMKYIVRIPLQP